MVKGKAKSTGRTDADVRRGNQPFACASTTDIQVERRIISPQFGSVAVAQPEHRDQHKPGLSIAKPSDASSP
jgi:hypothetical protein